MGKNTVQHFTPTAEQAEKMWTIINQVGNGYTSALRFPGKYANYAAIVSNHGAVDAYGYSVSRTHVGVRPALKLNFNDDIFRFQGENFKLEPGSEFKIGLKYDLFNPTYNWKKNEIDTGWMGRQPHNGDEIVYRVEYIDKKTDEVWAMPTLPITFGVMYNSELFDVGPCNYDRVSAAEDRRFKAATLKFTRNIEEYAVQMVKAIRNTYPGTYDRNTSKIIELINNSSPQEIASLKEFSDIVLAEITRKEVESRESKNVLVRNKLQSYR